MADTKTSDESAAGALSGTELVRIVQSSASVRTTTQAIANLASGSGNGLFSQVRSATPTIANTGLNTWLVQGGASVADVATGMSLTAPSNGGTSNTQVRGRYKTAPATPYVVTALLALNVPNVDYAWGGIGWYDGTNKLHVIEWYRSVSNPWTVDVRQWATPTSAGSVETNSSSAVLPFGLIPWFRLRDNGTTVFFEWSIDGSNFMTMFTIAKASGYLGSGGYSNLVLFTNAQTASSPVIATLLSWAVT